jgi:hypothetical protein
MTTLPKIDSTGRIAQLKLFFGSAVIFASMAVAGQADSLHPEPVPLGQTADVARPEARPMVRTRSLYPQTIQQAQSADVVRPTARPYQNNCTQIAGSPDDTGGMRNTYTERRRETPHRDPRC